MRCECVVGVDAIAERDKLSWHTTTERGQQDLNIIRLLTFRAASAIRSCRSDNNARKYKRRRPDELIGISQGDIPSIQGHAETLSSCSYPSLLPNAHCTHAHIRLRNSLLKLLFMCADARRRETSMREGCRGCEPFSKVPIRHDIEDCDIATRHNLSGNQMLTSDSL